MDQKKLYDLIESGESLSVEFKSDRRQISDNTIYEEIVALANTDGGVLLIGVEDDGVITGAKTRHGNTTDPTKLRASIFNNTVPNINTRITVTPCINAIVIAIEVAPYPEPCATASGKAMRRTIGADGKPQSVPFYPRDQRTKRVDLGLLDFSAQMLEETVFDDLDPLEFERMRQAIVRLRGDRGLLELSDQELAQALRLVETKDRKLIPNVAGMLLVGRENAIRKALPTHEVFFQVLDTQGNVKVNERFGGSLIQVLESVEKHFSARNEERELTVGMFRLPVPDYSPEGFREAANNAVLHRDYARNESVYIQWQQDNQLISSPGGLLSISDITAIALGCVLQIKIRTRQCASPPLLCCQ